MAFSTYGPKSRVQSNGRLATDASRVADISDRLRNPSCKTLSEDLDDLDRFFIADFGQAAAEVKITPLAWAGLATLDIPAIADLGRRYRAAQRPKCRDHITNLIDHTIGCELAINWNEPSNPSLVIEDGMEIEGRHTPTGNPIIIEW